MRATTLLSFVWLFYAAQIHGSPYNRPATREVLLVDGTILGKLLVTNKNTDFYAFQDIPYAQPPIGPLRLKESVRAEPWEGVLNTTENTKICYQFNQKQFDTRENEDCLVLNVYTPARKTDKELLPVLVWMHGGGFSVSSGAINSFGPHYFMDKKIVVVTVNFRLGPLGFLSTGDGVVPTNLGLKDQNLALKWVQRNIENFGADPTKVTIAGQESGAASVGYHVLNQKSEGLFRAAIMQSGTPLSCWALQKGAKNFAQSLAKALTPNNQSDLTSQEILHVIETADIEQLKTETIKLQIARSWRPDFANCLPMTSYPMSAVQEDENDENAYVTGMNHEKLKNGDIHRVPTLMGFNTEEMLIYNVSKLLVQTNLVDSNDSLAVAANLNMTDANRKEAGIELKKIYTNTTFASTPLGSISFLSDSLFSTPIARHAILQSKYTDVYLYEFSYVGVLGRYEYTDLEGAIYVGSKEELGYFWHNATSDNLDQFPKEDVLTHERVMDLWSQFIKHLNPTADNSELLGDLKWPKVTEEDVSYLDIDSELSVKSGPKKYTEWNRIYSKYGSGKFDTY